MAFTFFRLLSLTTKFVVILKLTAQSITLLAPCYLGVP